MSERADYDYDDLLNRGRLIQGLIGNFGAVALDSKPKQLGFSNGKERSDERGTDQDPR